ncbi:MAG: sulfurtransferase complex subunit TusC [Proteobacteria bacterium]|nr:sulfurtransferase complex subunit TusC [Pseudomonadota bacterium]
MNNASNKKTITFISRQAPYGRNNSRLCLDMALASAVFEQQVNYVFLDDGVLQLVKDQNAESINSKTIGNALETLGLYGINDVCVDKKSLSRRNLQPTDLIIDVKMVDRSAIGELIRQSDCVFNL